MKNLAISNEQLTMGEIGKHSSRRIARKQRYYSFLVVLLLFASCDLFTGPKVDLFKQISAEVDWANAPKLTVRIDYPPAWGVSNPSQGSITPAMDLRKGYEFSVEFTPDMAYTLQSWQVYLTEDLDNLTDGNWVESPELITDANKIQSLGPDKVKTPETNASGGIFKFTIYTTEPVTLVPLCDTQPRITRTEPRNRPDGPPYARASDIVLYFNGALNANTVRFANSENDSIGGIWITAESRDDDNNITITTYNKDEEWYSEPEYASVGGFFTVTMNSSTALPPPNSLMTVTVKGICNTQGKSMDDFSFQWKTSSIASVHLTSYIATYNDNGSISISWGQEGADKVETYYRLNNGGNNTIENADNKATITGVNKLKDSDVKKGSSVSNIEEYTIFIECYKEGIMESRATFKIWNFPGMRVSNTNLAVEIKTAADLAAIDLGKQYVLANDITVSNTWTPIGTSGAPFTGKFYGNGHTITFDSGSSIGGTANYRGLFGYAKDALIRDFTFEYNAALPINISAGSDIGGVAGYLENTTVSNLITSGGTFDINATGTGNVRLGGIVGYIKNGFITNCRAGLNVKLQANGGTVTGDIGAVAGLAESGSGGNIRINTNPPGEAISNTIINQLAIDGVTVTAKVSGNTRGNALIIGGAVGCSFNNTMRDINVSGVDISFYRTAITDTTCAGGVTGSAINSNMEACSFSGNAICKIDDLEDNYLQLGGLIGYYETNSGNVYINNCLVRGNFKVEEEFYNGINFEGGINIGGVLGMSMYKEGKVTITNSFFEDGNITATCNSGAIQAGGFCGIFYENGEFTDQSHFINNCGVMAGTVTIDIEKGGTWIHGGGFTSSLFFAGSTSNCFSRANVISRGNGDVHLPGQPESNYNYYTHQMGGFTSILANGSLTSCYATGTVRSVHSGNRTLNVGGLVGVSGGKIENCYALGDVLADKTAGDSTITNAGGLVGDSFGEITYSFSAGQVIAQNAESFAFAGGVIGHGINVNNTAALGMSVTANGPLSLPNPDYPDPEDEDAPAFLPGREAGRILGSGDGLSNNYANYKMLIGTGDYQKRITAEEVDEADTGLNRLHGEDITIGSHTVSDKFWRTTLGLGSSENNYGTMWDFSTVVGKGYPILKGLAGQ